MRISHFGTIAIAAALVTALGLTLAACGEDTSDAPLGAADDPGVEDVDATERPDAEADADDMTAAMAACDRGCLIGVTDDYLAALAANDPSAAPLAGDVRFVEDVTPMEPGQGLWETAVSGPTDFAIYVPDETNQTAGFLGVITRMAAPPAPQGMSAEERAEFAATTEKTEQPALIALRLKLEDGEIVEAEHLTTGLRDMAPFDALRSGLRLDSEIPPADRKPHAELIEIGESYYDALDDNDGTLMPFAADCERHENGMVTASPDPGTGGGPNNAGATPRDCAGQLSSNVMAYITTIDNRRVFAADPATGLVMGLSHFRHPMDFEPYEVTLSDGSTVVRDKDSFGFAPFDLPAAHVFKIGADGMVHEIEAMGFMAPYDSDTGWE